MASMQPAAAQDVAPVGSADDDRMSWWREARFGMFIHGGLYAIPAGTYDGERVGRAAAGSTRSGLGDVHDDERNVGV